ncbi:MAG: group 1 truncated hemoglobin [Myxococcales bacterium]|nr:group 1 truncated hemoglobin [Myxococcales bacterium]MCB9704959.1 group 1 truncated hemoglobin [Myxococcales bacterium]
MTAQNLYDKYGGAPTVSSIVHAFYRKVLDSESLAHYFRNIDMERLMGHQTKLFSSLMGGPVDYDVERMTRVHHALEIPGDHFDEVVELLVETLEDAGVDDDDVAAIEGAVRGLIDRVVEPS